MISNTNMMMSLLKWGLRRRLSGLFLITCILPLKAEKLPETRPAFFAPGSASLVNLIDSEDLFRKGQRDAWVMFSCGVLTDGRVITSDFGVMAFRSSPGAERLRNEVAKKLRVARFVPALYKHEPIFAGVTGTVLFVVANGKPHVRVYLNQEMSELKRGTDFVAPQLVWGTHGPELGGLGRPGDSSGTVARVTLLQSVDATGRTTAVRVLSESPAGQGFGAKVAGAVGARSYLPAYRNGKATACTITLEFRLLENY